MCSSDLRLSQAELEVGRFYYRIHWYPGAVDRLSTLVKDDPAFTNRDGAYYYLAESLLMATYEVPAAMWIWLPPLPPPGTFIRAL